MTQPCSFTIKDCTIASIATGRRAQNLRELRDHARDVEIASVYHHFWGSRLRPQFDDPEYNNDFAAWAKHALRDDVAAERLAVIDPTQFEDLEDLRREVVEVIEERLDESEFIPWSKSDQQFSFIRAQIVVIDTHRVLTKPSDLPVTLPLLPPSSLFYHFIDARRRTEDGRDDFSTWLACFGPDYDGLRYSLSQIDPYFLSLSELKQAVIDAVGAHVKVEGGAA